jgi:hypothetical protein
LSEVWTRHDPPDVRDARQVVTDGEVVVLAVPKS